MYPSLAAWLAVSGVATVRLDYRHPNHTAECVQDVQAALYALRDDHDVKKACIVGWSFGSAPALRSATLSPEVAGVALVAPQTADVGPHPVGAGKPVLFLHGSGDTCLSDRCSRTLHSWAQELKELVIYEGDDHGLTQHARQAEDRIFNFICHTLKGGATSGTVGVDAASQKASGSAGASGRGGKPFF